MNEEGLDVGDSISDENPEAAKEAWEGEGGADGEKEPVEADPNDPLLEQAKAAWEEENQTDPDAPQGGVMVGLSPLGPIVQVTSPNGDTAQKVVTVEELFLLGGQMIGIASFVMQMGMQAQMQEQAKLQQLLERGEEKTKGGVYVKRR